MSTEFMGRRTWHAGRTVVRMGALLVAAAVLAGPAPAQVSGTSVSGTSVPDNREPRLDPDDLVPPAYDRTLEQRDSQRLDAAREAGETFIPLIQGPGSAHDASAAAPAKPVRVRSAPTPPKPAYEGYRQPAAPQPAAPGREGRAVGDLIGVLIESWTRAPEIVRLRYRNTRAGEATVHGPGPAPAETTVGDRDARVSQATAPALPRIPAGRGLYARTLYAVDSDYPGPVLLELLEPPLAGAVVSGRFSLVRERLVLRLDRLEYRGRSAAVDAWAVGLDCACYGVDGEVDSHWFERVLLPSAARFAEGFLGALSRPNETVIVQGGDVRYERREAAARDAVHAGLATAARTAGGVLLESAPDGPSVRIPRDTELVVVFAASPEETGEAGDG